MRNDEEEFESYVTPVGLRRSLPSTNAEHGSLVAYLPEENLFILLQFGPLSDPSGFRLAIRFSWARRSDSYHFAIFPLTSVMRPAESFVVRDPLQCPFPAIKSEHGSLTFLQTSNRTFSFLPGGNLNELDRFQVVDVIIPEILTNPSFAPRFKLLDLTHGTLYFETHNERGESSIHKTVCCVQF
ncbi:hypothetical protein SISSUDRAFT_276664 [Sistotremastrum suecicum HHB10207 ss-3]|uniref:Uncharacterized protein n=1 Tax=Sistotremastrum suecicum HHB10207 ss-3 TaxID=1314776 RepID=A0A165ZM49_9AGAM|nr:hypothetical protein SISSUDRAFT_276664 [Sistotremastrum suecicum HHB10207 ss-3]